MAVSLSRSTFLTSVITSTKATRSLKVTECAVCSSEMVVQTSHHTRRQSQSRSRSRSPARGTASQRTRTRTRSPTSHRHESLRRAITIHDSHVMCETCTQTWFEGNNTCPFCRKEMFTNPEVDSDDSYPDGVSVVSDVEDEPAYPMEQYRRRDRILLNDLRLRNDWVKIYHNALRGLSSPSDIRLALLHISEQLSLRLELFNRQDRLAYWGEGDVNHTRVVRAIPTTHTSQEHIAIVASPSVNMLLWRWWWSHFTATLAPGTTSFFHHPVALELLLVTFNTVERWNSWRQDMATAKQCLGIALKPTIADYDGFAGGDDASHVAYLDDVMEAVAQAVVLGRVETVEGCDHAVALGEAYDYAQHKRIWDMM